MANFNRGEWSETYAIIKILSNPNLSIVNAELKEITHELYVLKSIKIGEYMNDNFIRYCLNNQNNIEVYYGKELNNTIENNELNENQKKIYNAIASAPSGSGSFEIIGIDSLLLKLTKGKHTKAKSFSKEDLELSVYDNYLNNITKLKYSIKSSLGSPATILNASQHTNFLYSIENFDEKYINDVNNIKTTNKLLDKIKFIKNHGGQIVFEKVVNPNFEYNLRMIDTNMPLYLGNVLLQSYITGKKNLKELFLNSNQFDDNYFALKKLGDFLESVSFGFFPSKQWNGINSVNGGLLVVKNNGEVVILDLIYFKNEVIKYLINETKLDSPSSTRYNMLHLYKDENTQKIYFTLNLQVRYKK